MDNENKNTPQEQDWFDSLVIPAKDAVEIGADESAIAEHDMSDLADMELDKIMQEAMSDEWDLSAIEHDYLSEPASEEAVLPQEQAYANEEAEEGEEPEVEPGDTVERKVRPRRKNGYGLLGLPHLVSTVIWIVLCVAIGVSMGRLIWICAADILAFGRPNQDVSITISASDDVDSVADTLYEAGLIKYRSLFKVYCQLAEAEVGGKISTGTFTLNTQYDYHALVGGMSSTSSFRETKSVTIPEGYTCAQIFERLEEYGICTVKELEAYCEESEFSSYWFLEGIEKGHKYCLEGFLFPDTYEFYIGSTAQQVFIKFLNSFDKQFTEEMRTQLETLNETLAAKYKKNGLSQNYIDEHKLTVKEVIIIASMIEKETSFSGESPTIASVIYNRLTNPSNYPKLNIDATVVYALGGKTDLTTEDLQVDSPYNTYLYEGLPPGPISNPGAYSLKAALNPADTKYYFYALDYSSEARAHAFFKTYKEHQNFLKNQG